MAGFLTNPSPKVKEIGANSLNRGTPVTTRLHATQTHALGIRRSWPVSRRDGPLHDPDYRPLSRNLSSRGRHVTKGTYGVGIASRPLHPQGCIYCRGSDGGFLGREHAIPESLGNKHIVLEPGVACDRCNNFMSRLDNALLSFMPIRLVRTLKSVPTKRRRLPWFEGPTGRIGLKSAHNIVVTDPQGEIFMKTGPNSFRLNVKDNRKLQPHDSPQSLAPSGKPRSDATTWIMARRSSMRFSTPSAR